MASLSGLVSIPISVGVQKTRFDLIPNIFFGNAFLQRECAMLGLLARGNIEVTSEVTFPMCEGLYSKGGG